ncbi:hypothetical protein PSD17_51050 [Pseudonocardia sp. D17]|nr:hypothetical protein PSD17_51050 [Pseudonocardia sp. D17]
MSFKMIAPPYLRSSFCNGNGCVEVAATDDGICVRDAKNTSNPAHVFSVAEWDAFVAGVKAGEFDSAILAARPA